MHPLISTQKLAEILSDPHVIPIYSRSVHGDSAAALNDFRRSHIPGSLYMDLDDELADRSDPRRGRHPLPTCEQFSATLFARGIGQEHTIVAYDDSNGSQAARLWWMLRWIGCDKVSLLDGGLLKWQSEQRPVETGDGITLSTPTQRIPARCRDQMKADLEVVAHAEERGYRLLDARSAERFRGEQEHIDKRAGHIPGALNSPYAENLSGMPPTFRGADELRAHFSKLGITSADQLIVYCGSGVTACHTLVALEIAGLSGGRLYPGSWSEWIENHI